MSTLEPAAQSKPPGGFKLWLSQLQMKHGRKLVIALPYIWLILLFLLPFLIVFKISLAEMARAIPPYTELMEWADGQLSITLNLGNFLQLTDDPLYFDAYLQSGNDSNLLIVFYVQIMPDDFVMQLHRF
ncbi:putrescine ABC transporter membrane protein [Escherichia coli]|nr:putrescine ABC transporter membrane protein [Escherichia coli]